MIALPSIELRDGACVHPSSADASLDERTRLGDPRSVLRAWERYGFREVHVVDLDAATGRGSNAPAVRDLLSERLVDVQVGGGVRSDDAVRTLLEEGARRVVVGTRAIEEPAWLAEIAAAFPGEIIVAADVQDRRVVTRGWSRTLARNVLDVVEELNDFPLAGVMVTAVHRERQHRGADLPLIEDAVEASVFPVYASVGFATLQELRSLADRGVSAVVIGGALYTGALDPWVVADDFAE